MKNDKKQMKELINSVEFAEEALISNATEAISRLMFEQSVSKSDLAEKLGTSRSWVTQLLSGRHRMTVKTLARVTYALGSRVTLTCVKRGK